VLVNQNHLTTINNAPVQLTKAKIMTTEKFKLRPCHDLVYSMYPKPGWASV